jgi:hypothetical protein
MNDDKTPNNNNLLILRPPPIPFVHNNSIINMLIQEPTTKTILTHTGKSYPYTGLDRPLGFQ